MMNRNFTFPKNFLWGTATSSHQVEGNNTNNDWWEWEQNGKLKERSGLACDHWNRFEEDFKLASSLHQNAHRFSLEWSRIEPQDGQFSDEVLLHYCKVIQSLRANNLEPIVTINHFTLPLWLSKKGGWGHPEAVDRFVRYVKRVLDVIGSSVRYWITFNEPMIYVYQGYIAGVWPPGQRSRLAVFKIFERLLHAHTLAYRLIHNHLDYTGSVPLVGISKHMVVFTPCNPHSFRDRLVTWIRNNYFNGLIANAFLRGHILPRFFLSNQHLQSYRYLDFIGLNYYTRDHVSWCGYTMQKLFGELCSLKHGHGVKERNSLGWEVYPEGIYECLKQLSRYRIPILITENGICTNDDTQRWRFIHNHLFHVARAIEEGVPVIGYLYWSLIDNFEWHEGFSPRFGLCEVDYTTQRRWVRPSAKQFSDICHTGKLGEKTQDGSVNRII